jgi:hypothetical protein
MGNISTTDARGLFTKMLIDVYAERATPTSFLRSFFPTVTEPTKELSIEVERCTEKIAVALSMVDLNTTTGYWTVNGHDPYADIVTGGNFLRQKGKVQGGTLNAILGSAAFSALLANTVFVARNDLSNLPLDAVRPPQRNSVGASYHGQISAGSYRVNLWSYNEFYDNAQGVSTPYIDEDNVILLPESPRFKLGFAAVPQLFKGGTPALKQGAFIFGEYMDERNTAHIMDIKSAGIAIPVAVDQIYTMKVKA